MDDLRLAFYLTWPMWAFLMTLLVALIAVDNIFG
jgi:hypothetical protein